MKTWNKIIRKFIDCDSTKCYGCRLCKLEWYTGSIEVIIDHIEEKHNKIYLEYREELSRVDARIKIADIKI